MGYQDSLVSRWDMSDINPPDLGFRVFGNNGTGNGLVAATDIVQGVHGKSMATEFDGTEWVTIANGGTFAPVTLETFSIALWYRTTDATRRNLIVQGGVGAGEHGLFFGLDTAVGNGLSARVLQNDGTQHLGTLEGANSNDGSWHHTVLSCTISDSMYLYRDGALIDSDLAPAGVANPTPLALFAIAGDYGGWNPFIGIIDDVRVYNAALTNLHATDLYVASAQGRI